MLVDFSGTRDLLHLMRSPTDPGEILKRWIACPHTTAYEAGRLPAELWAQRFVRDWDLTIAPTEFVGMFAGWVRGFFPGAPELLAELRPKFRLAALSNSNDLHWRRNRELGILQEFEFALGSHEVGCCKPDPAIFKAVVERASVAPDAIMFFDDQPVNVTAANMCGMKAFRVNGVEELRERLRTEGIL